MSKLKLTRKNLPKANKYHHRWAEHEVGALMWVSLALAPGPFRMNVLRATGFYDLDLVFHMNNRDTTSLMTDVVITSP